MHSTKPSSIILPTWSEVSEREEGEVGTCGSCGRLDLRINLRSARYWARSEASNIEASGPDQLKERLNGKRSAFLASRSWPWPVKGWSCRDVVVSKLDLRDQNFSQTDFWLSPTLIYSKKSRSPWFKVLRKMCKFSQDFCRFCRFCRPRLLRRSSAFSLDNLCSRF